MKSTTTLLIAAIVLCFAFTCYSKKTIEFCEYCIEENNCDTNSSYKCVNFNTGECVLYTDPCGYVPKQYYVKIHESTPLVKITVFMDHRCRQPISEPTKYISYLIIFFKRLDS
ncbi:hypothetical protein PPL_02939 [Heterostelium album PN500]|uniref:Uncharacterized protein n=1 Tax=Heterostelium pallidum (strain ATCC 26659 / Pp 5 / PN500) TaxID=670386 RepID=D3B3H1_HETP5|nr:hypothetical protein PPL_02939 [Heterostelium album PN500]EFA83869.1 hypothetical protein PPL_02939 [Heterostelium album PN500]|eukprot:XP_020435986.1 hypothetical protein PPL_02939 [Heterostelium album PN500]